MVKIFSNFDTGLMWRLVDELSEEYGKENVLYIRRDRIFFILRVLMPWTLRLLMTLLLLYVMYILISGTGGLATIVRWIGWGVIIVFFLYCNRITTISLMDYYLDFTIITPRQITTFDQTGVFSRSTRSLDIAKIKTIRIDKQGVLRSLFNFGSIVFLSEGDRADLGDITLDYISDPVGLRDKITEILNKTEIQPEDID